MTKFKNFIVIFFLMLKMISPNKNYIISYSLSLSLSIHLSIDRLIDNRCVSL